MIYKDFQEVNRFFVPIPQDDGSIKYIEYHADNIIAGDTDSVTGDTVIYVNGSEITIGEFYKQCEKNGDFLINDDFNKNYVIDTSDFNKTSLSVSSGCEIEEKPINYIMKHTVKKRMFRITVANKSVTVTEDHSIIILRDGELQSATPLEIKKTDELLFLA